MTASFPTGAATSATKGTVKIVGTPADAANPKVPVATGAPGDVGKTFDASTGLPVSGGITTVVLTQAAYDALGAPDADTLYVIVG